MMDEKTILIVDDTELNIEILMELLDDQYDMLGATSGEDALDMLLDEKVDLILLDIMMPNMDGYEVCKRLKANPETADIPVIFITAKIDEDSIALAKQVGGVDYIAKPFHATEVCSCILNHLAMSAEKMCLEDAV